MLTFGKKKPNKQNSHLSVFRTALYKGRPSPTCLEILGGPLRLFCECFFSGLEQCRFLLREICLFFLAFFFLARTHNLLLTLTGVCLSYCASFEAAAWHHSGMLFGGPQASRVYQVLSAPQVVLDRNQSVGQLHTKPGCWMLAPLFPY